MLDFFKTDIGIIILLGINLILFASVIITNFKISKIDKNNKEFIRKLGDGKDITENLEKYIDRVIDVEIGLSETNTYCKKIENQVKGCIQKVGVVKYNAYKDAGNDLSYAVALLDEKNNGIVFNGIYSKEMSNTFAKPIEEGKSRYSLTLEENQAIYRAMEND